MDQEQKPLFTKEQTQEAINKQREEGMKWLRASNPARAKVFLQQAEEMQQQLNEREQCQTSPES